MATYRGSANTMDDRNSLFGNRARVGGGGGGQNYQEEARRLHEEENNRYQAALGERVSHLKEIAIKIGGEVDEHNRLLSGMDGTFGQTGQLLSGTVKKLQHMIETGGSKHMCYLIAFVVGIFFFLYFGLRRV